ncbi:MAG TPA: hypothetical protein VI636_08940 [Candidatus Angelobacter sp.]
MDRNAIFTNGAILARERAFFDLAKRFRDANNPDELKQLGDLLGLLIFGE